MSSSPPSSLSKYLTGGVVVSVIIGIFTAGSLASDLKTLKENDKVRSEDHDTLVQLKTEQKEIKEDVAEIKEDVKDLDQKLDKILYEIRKE